MTNYYSTTQQNSTSPPGADELVDERWDGNLGFYSTSNNAQNQPQETTLIKDHQLDTLFQSKHISRQVSPPITDDKEELNTPCFKEDIDGEDDDYYYEEKDYFQETSSPIIILNTATPLTTPPLSAVMEEDEEEDCDYLTTQGAVLDNNNNNSSTFENYDAVQEEEDFSITAVNELSPIECIQLDQQESEQSESLENDIIVAPVNLENYHSELVQHYKQFLLSMTDESVMQSLPDMYNNYIQDIRKSVSLS